MDEHSFCSRSSVAVNPDRCIYVNRFAAHYIRERYTEDRVLSFDKNRMLKDDWTRKFNFVFNSKDESQAKGQKLYTVVSGRLEILYRRSDIKKLHVGSNLSVLYRYIAFCCIIQLPWYPVQCERQRKYLVQHVLGK